MNMMLVAIFASVLVGVASTRFGRRQNSLVIAIAALLTMVYFLRPQYMT